MKRFNSEKGFAFLMVMLVLLILSATVVVASASYRVQAKVSGMAINTTTARIYAEDGIEVAKARLQRGQDLHASNVSGEKFILNDNGWTVTVSYTLVSVSGNNSTYRLTSTAKSPDGRFCRSITKTVDEESVAGTGTIPTIQLNKAVFTNGNINLKHGASNLVSLIPCFANGNITIDKGQSSLSNTTFEAGGSVTNNSNNKNQNQITSKPNQTKLDFPEVDFSKLTTASGANMVTGHPTNISASMLNTPGIYYVMVNSSNTDITISGDVTLNGETTLVFIKDPTDTAFVKSGGNYTVHFAMGNFNGASSNLSSLKKDQDGNYINDGSLKRLNVFSDNGVLTFQNNANFNNPLGVVYTGASNRNISGYGSDVGAVFIDVGNNGNPQTFKVGGMIARGDVLFKSANFDYDPQAFPFWTLSKVKSVWNTGTPTIKYTLNKKDWREIAQSSSN